MRGHLPPPSEALSPLPPPASEECVALTDRPIFASPVVCKDLISSKSVSSRDPLLRKFGNFSLYSHNFCPNFSSQSPKCGNFQLTSPIIWKFSAYKPLQIFKFQRQMSVRKLQPYTSEMRRTTLPEKKLSAPPGGTDLERGYGDVRPWRPPFHTSPAARKGPISNKWVSSQDPLLRKFGNFGLYSLNFHPNFSSLAPNLEIFSSQAPKFRNFQLTSPQIWKFSAHKTPFSEVNVSLQAPHFGNPGHTSLPEKKLSARPRPPPPPPHPPPNKNFLVPPREPPLLLATKQKA